jgi:TRAP-type uncharacterized transport system substrate-binding protein
VRHISITAGPGDTTRALIARGLAAELSARGIETEVVDLPGTESELERVEAGGVDLALASGAFRIEGFRHVREVAPLYVEVLHLMVRPELAEPVSRSLTALEGRTVDLGASGGATAGLAAGVLAFAEVPGGGAPGGYVALNLEERELDALLERGDRSGLPDAVFHLDTLPSKRVIDLVRSQGYRLVALPFADAFRLAAILGGEAAKGPAARIERAYAMDSLIPAFTYDIEPPVPDEPLHTLGTRLILVANEKVSAETVEIVVETVFSSRFARMSEQVLEPAELGRHPRLALHRGTKAFLARNQPFITESNVDELSNTLSVLGALVGGGLFFWQGLRQRRQARRDELVSDLMLRVAARERRIVELELASSLQLEPLIALQRDLLELKSEVLERFTTGELGDQSALSDLLAPVNAARDHVGELLLHVREGLEEKAEAEGRTVRAVWNEASGEAERPREDGVK